MAGVSEHCPVAVYPTTTHPSALPTGPVLARGHHDTIPRETREVHLEIGLTGRRPLAVIPGHCMAVVVASRQPPTPVVSIRREITPR